MSLKKNHGHCILDKYWYLSRICQSASKLNYFIYDILLILHKSLGGSDSIAIRAAE